MRAYKHAEPIMQKEVPLLPCTSYASKLEIANEARWSERERLEVEAIEEIRNRAASKTTLEDLCF
jgi:hypothetical protein